MNICIYSFINDDNKQAPRATQSRESQMDVVACVVKVRCSVYEGMSKYNS